MPMRPATSEPTSAHPMRWVRSRTVIAIGGVVGLAVGLLAIVVAGVSGTNRTTLATPPSLPAFAASGAADDWESGPADSTGSTDRSPPKLALQTLATPNTVASPDSLLPTDGPDQRLTQVTKGTTLDGETIEGWTDRVLIAHPRVAAGDVDQITQLVKENAELLSFVLLARVERPAKPASPATPPSLANESDASDADATPEPTLPPAILADVGVGLAMKVGGRWQVVSGPATADPDLIAAKRPGPDLGFLSTQVLRTAARSLDDMRIVVRRTTLVIHDSPAVLKVGDQNTQAVVRSMIWVEPASGRLHHILWTLQRGMRDVWMPAWDQGVYLPVPTIEDRVLHVQADRFTLGIPSATAFGLNDLPPGYRFSLAGQLADLACRPEYDEATLAQLATQLIQRLRESVAPPPEP